MELARDTFTDVAYTVLSAHAEELSAASWAGFSNSTQLLISPGGKVFRSGYNPTDGTDSGLGADAFLSYAPITNDYKVQVLATWLGNYETESFLTGPPVDQPESDPYIPVPGEIYLVGPLSAARWMNLSGINNNPSSGSNHRFYIYARLQSGDKHLCYTFGFETTGSRYVWCRDQTDISSAGPTYVDWSSTSAAPSWSVGESRLFELECNGTTLTASVDGVTIFTATHSDYASGKAGFEILGGSSPIRGFHLDDFKILSLSGGSPPAVTPEMLSYVGSEGLKHNGHTP